MLGLRFQCTWSPPLYRKLIHEIFQDAPHAYAYALAWGAFSVPIVVMIAPLGLVSVNGVALVVFSGLYWMEKGARPRLSGGFALLLAGFLAWAALSALWAPDAPAALRVAGKLTLLSLIGLLMLHAAGGPAPALQRWIGVAMAAGLTIGLLMLALELVTGGLIHALAGFGAVPPGAELKFLKRPATVLVLMLWPAVLMLCRERRFALAGGLIVASGVLIFQTPGVTAKAAWAVSVLLFAVGWLAPRVTAYGLAAAFVAGVLLWPVLAGYGPTLAGLPRPVPLAVASAVHRLEIWSYVSGRIAEKPVVGWGLDASRRLPGKQGHIDIQVRAPDGSDRPPSISRVERLPLHPHSNPLQWWLELGLTGALLGSALIALMLRGIARTRADNCVLGAAIAQAGAAMVTACLAYGAWQSWWISTLWLAAMLTLAQLPNWQGTTRSG